MSIDDPVRPLRPLTSAIVGTVLVASGVFAIGTGLAVIAGAGNPGPGAEIMGSIVVAGGSIVTVLGLKGLRDSRKPARGTQRRDYISGAVLLTFLGIMPPLVDLPWSDSLVFVVPGALALWRGLRMDRPTAESARVPPN